MSYVECNNVRKVYEMGEVAVRGADNLSCIMEKGEFVVVNGPSGSGKTTLLNVLSGIDNVSSGTIKVDNKEVSKLNEKQLEGYRQEEVGIVFQFDNLVPNLTVLENVEIAKRACADSLNSEEVIRSLGLAGVMEEFPAQLTAENQQKVAIARAIVKKPKLLICDEPTGDLTCEAGKNILKLLKDAVANYGFTVILATHNSEICSLANRVIKLSGGNVAEESINNNPVAVDSLSW